MTIAIDGTSASGKSTISKILAEKLGICRFNVGMVYRALSKYLFDKKIKPIKDEIEKIANSLKIDVKFIDGVQSVAINNINFEKDELSTSEISNITPKYAIFEELRAVVRKYQREFAKNNSVLMEGRDVTSEVLPNADYKFFITSNYFVRSKRRIEQLNELGESIKQKQVIIDLFKRDYEDVTREVSPLKIVEGVIIIDTSNLLIDQTINKMLSYIEVK